MESIHGNARGRATRTGIAGGAHQRLQIHHQWARAFTGHDRGHAAGPFAAEKQLTGVVDLRQPLAPHLEHAQFMGGTKAILHRPKQAMTGESIAFEGQHRIHQVFQHLRASQHPFFGDMTNQQKRRVLTLGQTLQGRSTLPHLRHGPRGTGKVRVMQRLDTVDHSHVWPQRFQFLEHQLQIGFRQKLEITAFSRETLPAQLHLLG